MATPFFMEPLHILGSGSIGLLWASSIRSNFPSYPLRALFRNHHQQIIGPHETEITVCHRQHRQGPRMTFVPIQYIHDDSHNQRKIKNLILATKAFQAPKAVESILPRIPNESQDFTLTVLCNGALDVREKLLELFQKHKKPKPKLIMCTTTHGVYSEPPDDDMFHLVQTGLGRCHLSADLAEHNNIANDMAELWDRSGLNASCLSPIQMEVLLWKKLAANCVCNPLTALHHCTNGQLSDQSNFMSLREQIVHEVSAVATELNPQLHEYLSPSAMQEFVQIVIQDNLDNTSSMQRDVVMRQPTEIDNLNGYVVRKSKELNLNCLANEELYQKITHITKRYSIE